jgi:hypothetical protein
MACRAAFEPGSCARPSDLALLRWTAEQYAVSLPQLARLMGRSEHAARWLRDRWRRVGWAERRTLLVGRPVLVWVTRDGVRQAGVALKAWEPSPGALAHIEAVNDVRLLVAQRRPGAEWVSERMLSGEPMQEASSVRAHRPDAVVRVDDGRRLAVEVELTLKSRARIERIVGRLLTDYDAVWYFAAPAPARALAELAERAGSRVHIAPERSVSAVARHGGRVPAARPRYRSLIGSRPDKLELERGPS